MQARGKIVEDTKSRVVLVLSRLNKNTRETNRGLQNLPSTVYRKPSNHSVTVIQLLVCSIVTKKISATFYCENVLICSFCVCLFIRALQDRGTDKMCTFKTEMDLKLLWLTSEQATLPNTTQLKRYKCRNKYINATPSLHQLGPLMTNEMVTLPLLLVRLASSTIESKQCSP